MIYAADLDMPMPNPATKHHDWAPFWVMLLLQQLQLMMMMKMMMVTRVKIMRTLMLIADACVKEGNMWMLVNDDVTAPCSHHTFWTSCQPRHLYKTITRRWSLHELTDALKCLIGEGKALISMDVSPKGRPNPQLGKIWSFQTKHTKTDFIYLCFVAMPLVGSSPENPERLFNIYIVLSSEISDVLLGSDGVILAPLPGHPILCNVLGGFLAGKVWTFEEVGKPLGLQPKVQVICIDKPPSMPNNFCSMYTRVIFKQ